VTAVPKRRWDNGRDTRRHRPEVEGSSVGHLEKGMKENEVWNLMARTSRHQVEGIAGVTTA